MIFYLLHGANDTDTDGAFTADTALTHCLVQLTTRQRDGETRRPIDTQSGWAGALFFQTRLILQTPDYTPLTDDR